MNKDFEKEYKELAEIEAPDLWDRIEAGITKKEITEKEITEKSMPETKKKITVRSFVKRYSLLAAALFCAVIIIPALNLMRNSATKGMSSGSATDMNYSAAAADTCTAEEEYAEAETTEEAAAEAEEPVETSEGKFIADAGEEAPMESAPSTDIALDDSASITDESDSLEETKMQKEEAAGGIQQEAESSRESEKQELFNIVIKVTEAKDRFDEDSTLDELGTLYTAVVEKDPSGTLTEGEQIEIFIPVYSSYGLAKDEIVELDLVFDENADYFSIAGYHG